jgi:hypothetical protein
MTKRAVIIGVSLIAACWLMLASPVFGQTTTATLNGVVTDQSGAVLPGTEVSVTNSSTGVTRTVTSGPGGRFTAPELLPGPYQLKATKEGFQSLVRSGITLEVGQQAEVNLTMQVGTVSEQVTITAEAPMVNTDSSAVAGVVNEKNIEELPLNGRDFSQLPLVEAGVAAIRNGDVTVTKGFGTRVAMGGSRPDQTAWLLDGANVHSPSNFGTPGSAAGLMLGVDAVREFQVLTSDYSAELGGTSGGVVNMVTKSGTNQLHGSAFEFLRNSDLDARNFFDIPAKAPFKRNQFGGSLGGRIKKDKTFFFGSYEGLRQRQSTTVLADVPTAATRQGMIPATGGGFQQVTVAPEIVPYLTLFPAPNGASLGGGLGQLYQSGLSPVTENYFVVRVDHHINDSQSIFARVSYDQGNGQAPDALPITATTDAVHSRYATVQHDLIVTPQFLMTSRLNYDRSVLLGNEINTIPNNPSLDLFLPGWLPDLSFPGVTGIGPSATNLINRAQNVYEFDEGIQYVHGAHSMKFGVQINHEGYIKEGESAGLNGSFTWATLGAFLQDGTLSAFNATAQGGSLNRQFVQYVYGFYFQDDWKMTRNFTWNLGLRYEPWTAPSEKHDRISALPNWPTATAFQTGIGLFQDPSHKNFSPRIGFAWDPKGDGKTAIRAGFGIFYVVVGGAYYATPDQKNPPYFGSTAVVQGNLNLASSVSYMTGINSALLNPVLNSADLAEILQYNLNPSYEIKYNFAVERQLPGAMALTVGYTGDRGIHLWRLDDINDSPPILVNGRPFVVAGTPRVNPNLGAGTTRYSDAQSFYNGLQVSLKKRFSHGFQLQSSYTWSKNIDDSTTGVAQTDFVPGGNGVTSQPYNPKADRGLSSLDVGQTLVINGIYALPSPAKGVASAVLGGWQVASIFTANSGAPFSIYISNRNAPDQSRSTGTQHPDLVAGTPFSSITTGNPNAYITLSDFYLPPAGFYGDAGRNIAIGPKLFNLDFSLQKNTPLRFREGTSLEFHADFFNLFNHPNFANPRANAADVLNPTNGQYIATAGQIISTVTTSRQIQVGLKFIF